jgi:hypothetical protein
MNLKTNNPTKAFSMLNYNTRLSKLVLPEYGRNIQRMVDHCLTIEDREERTRCAHSIIRSMGNLFPELRAPENEHKLWDHLAMMAGFKLDIDFPYEVIQEVDLRSEPECVPYTQAPMRYRHYGHLIQQMIDTVATMAEGPARDEAIALLANHMKKQMLAVNAEGVEDAKVFSDLLEMSHGAIRVDASKMRLYEFREVPQPGGKKKKKKTTNTIL